MDEDTNEIWLVSEDMDRVRIAAIARAIATFGREPDWIMVAMLAEEAVNTARWRICHPKEDRVTFIKVGPR